MTSACPTYASTNEMSDMNAEPLTVGKRAVRACRKGALTTKKNLRLFFSEQLEHAEYGYLANRMNLRSTPPLHENIKHE